MLYEITVVHMNKSSGASSKTLPSIKAIHIDQPGSGERKIVRSDSNIDDDEEDRQTYPDGNIILLTYQKLINVFDSMEQDERLKFINLAEAWINLKQIDRDFVLCSVEKAAGIR